MNQAPSPAIRASRSGGPASGINRTVAFGFTGLIFVLGLLLAARLVRYVDMAIATLRYPYQLDYGEGVVWQQSLLIFGPEAYGPIEHYPNIVFHYPPLFHIVAAALTVPGLDPLATGRAVSMMSLGLLGLAASGVTWQILKPRFRPGICLCAAGVTLLVIVTCQPILHFSRLMRVDMLAEALSMTGLAFAIASIGRPALRHASVVFFVLALYTKQTTIAAPTAAFLVLLWHDRSNTLKSIALGLALGLAILLYWVVASDGGFIRHIILYNINQFSLAGYVTMIKSLADHAIYFAMSLLGIGFLWHDFSRRRSAEQPVRSWPSTLRDGPLAREGTALAILTVFVLIAHAITLTGGKSGSNHNYFIVGMCSWALVIGVTTASVAQAAWRGTAGPSSLFLLAWPAALITQVWLVPLFGPNISGIQITNTAEMAKLAELTERVRAAERPVLSDDIVTLLRAGKRMPWEPIIFVELAAHGHWNEDNAVRMIADGKFAFIMTERQPGEFLFNARFTPAMRAAMAKSYPRTETLAGRTLLLPP